MKKILLAMAFISLQASSQPLECQLLRDDILTEARQRRLQNSEQIAAAQGFAAGQNLLGGILAQTSTFAQRGGEALSQGLGQSLSLEQKIQLYQQSCEK